VVLQEISLVTESLPIVYLKKREDRRIRRGHPWVFSNEVDTDRSPLQQFEAGDSVELRAADETSLGSGYINPRSLIAVRLLGRGTHHRLTNSLLKRRFEQALALREKLFTKPFYRLVHGEGDALPGLVIDRYGSVFTVQISTAGMDAATEKVVTLLQEMFAPEAIVLRNDIASRALEGLEQTITVADGSVPESIEIEENDARFIVNPSAGQKTGWFYDQRLNRQILRRYSAGLKVLDLFSYTGGFGINAALAGATEVCCMDSSASALAGVAQNASLNGVSDQVETLEDDVFKTLGRLRSEGRKFDLVIVDPPALIPRRKDRVAGGRAYERLNRQAIALLEKDGYFFSASCSFHLDAEQLRDAIFLGARTEGRRLQFLERGQQGPDHPIRPNMPESEYLKLFVSRVMSG
jgi:23S rRNA (cytosine1962-C5)-methyltransferase